MMVKIKKTVVCSFILLTGRRLLLLSVKTIGFFLVQFTRMTSQHVTTLLGQSKIELQQSAACHMSVAKSQVPINRLHSQSAKVSWWEFPK